MATLRRSVTRMLANDGTGLAAELAFRAFFALAPFLVFLTALAAWIASFFGVTDVGVRLVDLLGATMPANVAVVLRDQLTSTLGRPHPGLLSIGFAAAFWAATGGVNTLVKATNRAFGVQESRPFWRRYGVAMGLTVLAGALVLGALAVVAVAGILGLWFLPLPIVLVLLFVAAVALYRAGPNVRLPMAAVAPGAAVFSVLWAAVTYAFSLYVARFGSYDATYGALGAVVVLLMWLYLVSLALVYGAELNAAIAEGRTS